MFSDKAGGDELVVVFMLMLFLLIERKKLGFFRFFGVGFLE